MTPCEKLGYKVGDKFEVLEDAEGFTKGQTVELKEDDGTECPFFANDSIEEYYYLKDVKPLNQPEEQPNDLEDREFDALEKQGRFTNLQKSDGSTASYYELPQGATELQDLISERDMNAQIGEIFRACYRYGQVAHSDKLRDAKKIKFYAEAEIKRLENQGSEND